VVASTTERNLTGLPVKFSIDLDGVTIDPATTYTIQATIVDGENAWATGRGIPVLTKGNPSSDVAITLDYRPDLIKGAVSGQITGTDVQVGANGYAMAVLLDPVSGDSLGIDVRTITAGLPVAFSVGFTITDIVPTEAYVVTAEVGDGTSTWRNAGGVPVITNGNPKAGVQVPVTAVSVASPSPAPTLSPAPSPTPAPTPPPGIGTSGNLLLWIILVASVGAVAAFLVARNRDKAAGPRPPTRRCRPTSCRSGRRRCRQRRRSAEPEIADTAPTSEPRWRIRRRRSDRRRGPRTAAPRPSPPSEDAARLRPMPRRRSGLAPSDPRRHDRRRIP
jgi:uncharacterized lipoprotein YbaY